MIASIQISPYYCAPTCWYSFRITLNGLVFFFNVTNVPNPSNVDEVKMGSYSQGSSIGQISYHGICWKATGGYSETPH